MSTIFLPVYEFMYSCYIFEYLTNLFGMISFFPFRVFNPLKLQFIVTIPKPHFLGVNVAEGIDSR